MEPTVSVIIPTYNHAAFVVEAVESVLRQSFADHEIIVINDGSTDETALVLQPYCKSGSIIYVEQPNMGQSAARNKGLELARGKYIAFLDDDDIWPPDKLRSQVAVLASHPEAVMVWGRAVDLYDGRELLPCTPSIADSWQAIGVLFHNLITSPGQTLIRLDTIRQIGGLDQGLWGTDDWDLYIRLSHFGRFEADPSISLLYRYHGNNASRNGPRMLENQIRLRQKHRYLVENLLMSGRMRNSARGSTNEFFRGLCWLAWHEFTLGELGRSRYLWLDAMRASPRGFVTTDAWRQAKAAFLPSKLRTFWQRMWRRDLKIMIV